MRFADVHRVAIANASHCGEFACATSTMRPLQRHHKVPLIANAIDAGQSTHIVASVKNQKCDSILANMQHAVVKWFSGGGTRRL
jgi:hypothetical protein